MLSPTFPMVFLLRRRTDNGEKEGCLPVLRQGRRYTMVVYEGFFCDTPLKGSLEKDILFKHITTEFKPRVSHSELYGKEATFSIKGYGCDGKNEGYLVELAECDDEELVQLFTKIAVPHITLSVSAAGKPVDTAKLSFAGVEPITVKARFGGYENGCPVF